MKEEIKKGFFPMSRKDNSRSEIAIKNKIFPISKRSQLTVFIILAIGIFLVLILLFTNKSDFVHLFVAETPVEKIQKCLQDLGTEGKNILLLQGGSIEPKNYFLYEGNKVSYACYTGQFYVPCVMQKPLLKNSIETEIKTYIESKIEPCLVSVKSSLESKGYSVDMKTPEVDVNLIPNNMEISANLDLQISKENTEYYKSVKTNINSNLYDFVIITSSILNWEARYGDTETMNFMYYYPLLKVEKKPRSEGTKIYILTDRETQEKFMFATRSMAFPAGVTGR